MPDRQDSHSQRVTLYSSENALSMLILVGQGSIENVKRLAGVYAPAEIFKERRGYTIIGHLEDDTKGYLTSAG